MENIGIAFLAIAAEAHDWAEEYAWNNGWRYSVYRAKHGDNNRYYREALDEMWWQADGWDREPVSADFEIEF